MDLTCIGTKLMFVNIFHIGKTLVVWFVCKNINLKCKGNALALPHYYMFKRTNTKEYGINR